MIRCVLYCLVMKKNPTRILLVTEDFPSGLNGTSVKTRNTLIYLLERGFLVDVCCFHFPDFKVHGLKHRGLKVFTATTPRHPRFSPAYLWQWLTAIFSLTPLSLKRLFNPELASRIKNLVQKNQYDAIFYDGYSTLQYLVKQDSANSAKQIYIDDEDFTDLFRQRLILEKSYLIKFFYLTEYLKSLVFESKTLPVVDQIWAISSNTQERLARISSVKTVLMPTVIPAQKNLYRGVGYNLVFTGTLNWRENVEGLTWFLKNHWPQVIKKLPQATLTVIGQGARPKFIEFLKQQKNVIYLGYAPDLSLEYQKTALAISPVLINAGIKVKTLTYLSFGLPVVSSPVAAWGLVATGGVAVAEDHNFGRLVVALLKRPRLRSYLSRQAQQNIKINYGERHLGDFLQANLSL